MEQVTLSISKKQILACMLNIKLWLSYQNMPMADIPILSQESLKSHLEMQKSWENNLNSSKTRINIVEKFMQAL
jgi:hypothetical protein